MTKLSQRRTRLIFETGETIRSRGKLREIVVGADTYGAYVRLKGTKQRLPISYGAIYVLAAKLEANRVRAEKLAAKKGVRR